MKIDNLNQSALVQLANSQAQSLEVLIVVVIVCLSFVFLFFLFLLFKDRLKNALSLRVNKTQYQELKDTYEDLKQRFAMLEVKSLKLESEKDTAHKELFFTNKANKLLNKNYRKLISSSQASDPILIDITMSVNAMYREMQDLFSGLSKIGDKLESFKIDPDPKESKGKSEGFDSEVFD